MPITAECPKCGFKGSVPDQFKGKKVKCRQCSNFFLVGGPVPAPSKNGSAGRKSNPDLVEMELVEDSTPPTHRAKPTLQAINLDEEMSSPFANIDEAPRKVKGSAPGTKPTRPSAQNVKATRPSAPGAKAPGSPFSDLDEPDPSPKRRPRDDDDEPRKKKGRRPKKKEEEPASPVVIVLGVMALILSGAAMGVAKLDMIGLISVPLSGLGLLLGIGGVVMAWGRPGLRVLAPGLATLVSFVALPLSGWFTYRFIDGGGLNDKNDNRAAASAPEAPSRSDGPPSQPVGPAPTEPKVGTKPDTQPKKDPPPDVPKDPDEVDMPSGTSQIGTVVIQVKELKRDDKEKRTLVRLTLKNLSTDKLVNYDGWGTSDAEPVATITDNSGGVYKRQLPKLGETIPGQLLAQTLQPDKDMEYSDVIVFDLPPEKWDKLQFLRISLPASNLDDPMMKGKNFRFKVPRSVLLGKPPVDPKDPPKPKRTKEEIAAILDTNRKVLTNQNSRPPERENALKALAELGTDARPAAGDIAIVLTNKMQVESVRVAAAAALGEIGPAARDQVPALIQAIQKDDFHGVKAAAAKSLGQMGVAANSALPALRELLKSQDEGVAPAARKAIKLIDPNEKLP